MAYTWRFGLRFLTTDSRLRLPVNLGLKLMVGCAIILVTAIFGKNVSDSFSQ